MIYTTEELYMEQLSKMTEAQLENELDEAKIVKAMIQTELSKRYRQQVKQMDFRPMNHLNL
jgi:hypothetical protein